MAFHELGQSALVGWRKPVAEKLAGPLESRTSLSGDQARAAFGVIFFLLSVYYVIGTVKRLLADD